ncbi:hypothetical protein GUJ93_ZPchr0012g19980 [Zizania palustris]|uniref:Phosphoglycerate kinase n=1 Tax=Zizania palustris TaxID=103762 RepID=A0A8J6BS97_ZIZPA|nr:hypothetical protein GUJ93_ZPchr0012g19980 [Zizania palustris]
MLCFPLLTDQLTNHRLVVREWLVDVPIKDCDVVSADEVRARIEGVMREKKGKWLREQVRKMKGMLEAALAPAVCLATGHDISSSCPACKAAWPKPCSPAAPYPPLASAPNGTEQLASRSRTPPREASGLASSSSCSSSTGETRKIGGAKGSGAAAGNLGFVCERGRSSYLRWNGFMKQACSVLLLRPSRPRRREQWPPSGSHGLSGFKCTVRCCQLPQSASVVHLQEEDKYSCVDRSTSYLHVQSVRNFPIEKFHGEAVLVRLDSVLLCDPLGPCNLSLKRTLSTIKYLYKAGAKVLLVTSWVPGLESVNPVLNSIETFAEHMSSLLRLKVVPVKGVPGLTSFKLEEWLQNDIILFENLSNFRGENTNCNNFSQKLASGAAIFVNDSFSLSHKLLASTVGITRFCHASLAGFHFEEELMQLTKITDTTRRPYIAIIGGSNFLRKAPALKFLASQCDGLFFVGKLSFQIMNGYGILVPSYFVEKNATKEVLHLIQIAHNRNIPIYHPTDFWCLNNSNHEILEILDPAELLAGSTPADIGPSTLEKISLLISLHKKVLWIGPTGYDLAEEYSVGAMQLGRILDKASCDSCDVILVGNAACKAVKGVLESSSQYTTFENSSVVWEFLKERILPGIAALDKQLSPPGYPPSGVYSTVPTHDK